MHWRSKHLTWSLKTIACLATAGMINAAAAPVPEPNGAGVAIGVAPASWLASGPHCMEVSDWQVHEYNANTYIIRQSGCLDYEKPFLYLIFGADKALLFDTGSRNSPVSAMLRSVVGKYLDRTHKQQIEVLAVHSHSHEDHVWGDKQLAGFEDPRIHVRVIPADIAHTKELYGIGNWPEDTGHLDLGDRMIDVVPIPGHDTASVALYDRQTGVLLTGDSLYPGRLYVSNWRDFAASTKRLVSFTQGKVIAHIFGCHIEQTSVAYLDYKVGTIYQPHEHELGLSRGNLLELDAALDAAGGAPQRVALRDFTIWPASHSSTEEDAFKERRAAQKTAMWDQPLQSMR